MEWRNPAVDGKNGPDGNIHVNIGRAIQGINSYYVLSPFIAGEEHIFFFFGYDCRYLTAIAKGPHKPDMGNHVQFLLLFPLYILRAE